MKTSATGRRTSITGVLLASTLVMAACGDKPGEAPAAQADPAPAQTPTTAEALTPADTSPGAHESSTASQESPTLAEENGAQAMTEAAAAGTADAATPDVAALQPTAAAPATAPASTPPAPTATGTSVKTSTTTTAAAALPAGNDPGTLTRAETLREKPFADAAAFASLAAGTKINIITREGAWYQVASGSSTGWVRMLSVRRSEAATTTVQGIAGVASGRTGTGTVVTTTGIRGLDSQALASAAFNEARIAGAESLRVSRADADAWARQAGLGVRDIPALPAPKK